MSAGSGPIAHREAGQSDPFLRRELRGPVLVLARGLGLVFTVLTLVMYARWLDLGLAVARPGRLAPWRQFVLPGDRDRCGRRGDRIARRLDENPMPYQLETAGAR